MSKFKKILIICIWVLGSFIWWYILGTINDSPIAYVIRFWFSLFLSWATTSLLCLIGWFLSDDY